MILLRISYRLRAHHMASFEKIFADDIRPVAKDRGLHLEGFFRTQVGNVGEYMELWRFESMAEFEERWYGLLDDPRIQKIFETTGPMVEGEVFSLLEPIGDPSG